MNIIEKLKQAVKNQNFTLALVLIVGGLWTGFSPETGTALVSGIYALSAVVGTLINFFKDAKMDWLKWIKNSNFWTYLSIILLQLFPSIPGEVFDMIRDIVTNIIGQNWNELIGAIFALVTWIYKIVTTKPSADPALS